MKLWTPAFALALALTVFFGLVALPLGLRTDPETGEAIPLLKELTESGIASFVFLLLMIYVISHAGSWTVARIRQRGKPEPAEETKGRRGRAKSVKGRK